MQKVTSTNHKKYHQNLWKVVNDTIYIQTKMWVTYMVNCHEFNILIYTYIICMCTPYMSSVIGRIYIQRECHSVLAKLHPITFYRIVFLGSARFLGWMPLFVFFGLPIVSCSLIKSNTRMLVTFGICFKQHFDTRYFVFYNPSPPRMFLSLDLLWEYRIQHGANGPLNVTSSY